MLTTQCRFLITHDGKVHDVIHYTHTGKTHIYIDNRIAFEADLICEDRKAAELYVQIYTINRNSINAKQLTP